MVRRPRRRVEGPRLDGARALDRFLRARDVSVPAFCEEHNLDRMQVQRLLSGAAKRPDVGVLLHIEKATDGAVAVASWDPDTLRDDEPGEVVPVADDTASSLPRDDGTGTDG